MRNNSERGSGQPPAATNGSDFVSKWIVKINEFIQHWRSSNRGTTWRVVETYYKTQHKAHIASLTAPMLGHRFCSKALQITAIRDDEPT